MHASEDHAPDKLTYQGPQFLLVAPLSSLLLERVLGLTDVQGGSPRCLFTPDSGSPFDAVHPAKEGSSAIGIGEVPSANAGQGDHDSRMSIRISEGGRLFAIVAGLGGAAMVGSAALTWSEALLATPDFLVNDIRKLNVADRRAMLLLGLFVIAAAACFIALGSRRMRMTAGALLVLAAGAGLIITLLAESPSLVDLPNEEFPCTALGPPSCIVGAGQSGGRLLAGFGAIVAAGYGIVALLRLGGGSARDPATGRSPTVPSGANPTGDLATPHKRPMSDASLLGVSVGVVVIALLVAVFVFLNAISQDL
jgi:hypothetical protein